MKGRFSGRHGIITASNALQKGSIDERLRNRLWSCVSQIYFDDLKHHTSSDELANILFWNIWDDFLGKPVDTISDITNRNVSAVRDWFFSAKWNEVYDFLEFLGEFKDAKNSGGTWDRLRKKTAAFIVVVNEKLAQEKAAYRFVGSQIAEVTNDSEIMEINQALEVEGKYSGARAHIQSALKLYSNREQPDYRNSVKESISAIESVFTSINGKKSSGLAAAIKLAENGGLVLHPALRNGIISIYGWTSDDGGIRHGLTENSAKVREVEARLMLILCSALMNYLISQKADGSLGSR